MKKLFLIPLMAMLCTVMAWGETAHVKTIAALRTAIANASVETIYLDADIKYTDDTQGNQLNIARSLTIDGQGHTLSGYGKRTSSVYNIFSINNGGGSTMVDVVFKDLSMIINKNTVSNDRLARVIETRGNIRSIELNNVIIGVEDYTKTYAVGLQIGGSQASKATLIITNSTINVGNPGYPVLSWNPYEMTVTNSVFAGYCGLYFKGVNGSTGSRGSVVNATNCSFECPNVYSGVTNAFSCFPLEDDGITLNLHNCGMNIQEIGDQNQALITTNNSNVSRRTEPVNVTISGDNSHFNIKGGVNKTIQNLYLQGSYKYQAYGEINVAISGGTYSINPEGIRYCDQWIPVEEGDPTQFTLKGVTIPDGYEVSEVNQGGVTLYRVVKKAAGYVDPETEEVTLYDLNDAVETAAEGENPVTSFELSTGGTMELDEEREVTTAGYVQVKDNEETGDATVVKVGTTDNEEKKVDQTLVINNGLDVQGESQVVVQAGSTLQIGEGGINTESSDNIVIEADEDGAASLLLDPTITVNQCPNLTVKMLAQQIGRDASGDFWWHRYAMPVAHIDTWTKEGSLVSNGATTTYPTYVYAWDYEANDWANIAPSAMEPLQGYTLTLASDYIHVNGADEVVAADGAGGNLKTRQDVYYTFKGNLVGNTDQPLVFKAEGFNFFGNSYTGYMDALTVLNGIESEHVDGSIYMWNSAEQVYEAISKYKLTNARQRARLADWQKEIAPMHTFILRLRGADEANEGVSYADAIWGNPRYNNAAPAPARLSNADDEDAYFEIKVIAANGKSDVVDFTQLASKSDAFESDYDAEKYMNRKSLNLYADVEGVSLSSVVTDNLLGKTLSLQTVSDVNYTMTFANVEGNEYALLDKATNQVIAITNGATYTFSAQPNSLVENRFEIAPIAKVPTAVENTESTVKARGIYTMLGQYMGEDINALPAGVYIVNGVKVVK